LRLNELRQIDVPDPISLLDLTAFEQSRNALKNLSFFYSFKDQPEDLHLSYQHTKPAMTFIKHEGVPFEARSASWERLLL
jgi:hypothetical protein